MELLPKMFSGHVHLYLFLLLLLGVDSSFRKKTAGTKKNTENPIKPEGGKVLLQMSYSPHPPHLPHLTAPDARILGTQCLYLWYRLSNLFLGSENLLRMFGPKQLGDVGEAKNLETQKSQHKIYRKESGDVFFGVSVLFLGFEGNILGARFTWKVSETPNFEPKTASPKKQGESSFLKNDDGFPIDRLKFPLPGRVISVCHLYNCKEFKNCWVTQVICEFLGGDFKYVLFSSLFGEDSHFD